jgi:hypothetical protein
MTGDKNGEQLGIMATGLSGEYWVSISTSPMNSACCG